MKAKSILGSAIVVLLFALASASFATTASFQGLGDLIGGSFSSEAYGVSADGSVVVGRSESASGTEAFRWENGVMQGLGYLGGVDFFSDARGVSGDGSVVVGQSLLSSHYSTFYWTEQGGMQSLGDTPTMSYRSVAHDASYNGAVIVGRKGAASGSEAFRWTESGGIQGLGDLPGGDFYSYACSVSDNGDIVVGYSHSGLTSSPSYDEAFRWTEAVGMQGLGDLPGGDFYSIGLGISADGETIVGHSESTSGWEAFRWTESSEMEGLGDLSGGDFRSWANDTSGNGAIIVGVGNSAIGEEAFIWDAENGMQNLQDVLVNDYGLNLTGWTLNRAYGISDNGLSVAGYGTNPDGYTEAWIATFPEPSTPPIADADGPYSIEVDDTLTLDASGSTDDDNDIVSYMWDLDDDSTFETDTGGLAVFDVNYSYLESLELLINHTYTIHLKVTDSEGQSDTADSTLTIVPKPALAVAVDIKPGSCPNPVNTKSSGVLPVAILGSADVNVIDIDPTSIAFSIGEVRVGSIRSSYEDVAAPVSDTNDCNCIEAGPDGFLDLTLKFETQRIVEAIGDVNHGDILTLMLTGVLFDETPIEGADCILIRGKHKSLNKADINKDGVVNTVDFAIFSENWLQSSIVDD